MLRWAASIYFLMGEIDKSKKYLEYYEEFFGHYQNGKYGFSLSSISHLANAYALKAELSKNSGDVERQVNYLKKAIEIYARQKGSNHYVTIVLKFRLAKAFDALFS